MPKVDLSITISIILGCAAVLSPIFTTIIDNCFRIIMKKIDLNHQKHQDTAVYVRKTFESYLEYAGQCISCPDNNARKEYGKHYYAALLYATGDLRTSMITAHALIYDEKWCDARLSLEEVTELIYTKLQIESFLRKSAKHKLHKSRKLKCFLF